MEMAQRKKTTKKKSNEKNKDFVSFYDEIFAWLVVAVSIFLFLSNFGIGGAIGEVISGFFFGIFGWIQYFVPVVILFFSLLLISNKFSSLAIKKTILGGVLTAMACIVSQMVFDIDEESLVTMFEVGSYQRAGGGLLGGSFLYLLRSGIGTAGAIIVTMLMSLISLMLITERSIMKLLKGAVDDSKEKTQKSIEKKKEIKKQKVEKTLQEEKKRRDVEKAPRRKTSTIAQERLAREVEKSIDELISPETFDSENVIPKRRTKEAKSPQRRIEKKREAMKEAKKEQKDILESPIRVKKYEKTSGTYAFPSVDFLKKGTPMTKGNQKELKETAIRLQQTLKNFGVNVTITNISSGPTVTRYELQPELGVKVSKIVNLTDDIKLNLAAADIRIEAPIPGKAAIGIEVPNQKNQMVLLRDLVESREFQQYPSKIGFTVGKDIAGKNVFADIEGMPHLLIAGATGSGKSICINTIIMSILYKASPKDVKLIMIDPKVVELSVYEGIPHLLIPVVTDPKKAAGSLNWAVSEMERRYGEFAEFNVRNIQAYNQKVDRMSEQEREKSKIQRMPQIVIIIDELADLMMVASKDVEKLIVRLTQLARAAGIHLVIATQRPSVDVITGLIKANVPSRIAFAVSSGVDSRTIIDMNGAERLLGKGDMLFFPSGYKKPIRVQGAFVSDEEVANVVSFLRQQKTEEDVDPNIEKAIQASVQKLSGGEKEDANGRDEYFYDAASFIIDKDKASIASLQRVFKIGFNRASRLMDQLCEAGVVGEEVGTKPRKVIMSQEQFEQMKEEEM